MKNSELKNYFLGLLSAKDAEAIELQIISGDDIESELFQAENDLIEDYLDGNLANEERQAFNDNFLITEERRERVEFVRLMRNRSHLETFELESKPSFFEQLKAFAAIRLLTLAFASLALIFCLGIGWQIIFNSGANVADTELIALNKQDLSNLEEFKNLKNLSLTSGTLRSGGGTITLPEKDLTDRVFVRLILPNKIDPTNTFNVKISNNSKILSTFTQRIYNQEVRLLLPKSIFVKGDYQITLEKQNERYIFYFAVN